MPNNDDYNRQNLPLAAAHSSLRRGEFRQTLSAPHSNNAAQTTELRALTTAHLPLHVHSSAAAPTTLVRALTGHDVNINDQSQNADAPAIAADYPPTFNSHASALATLDFEVDVVVPTSPRSDQTADYKYFAPSVPSSPTPTSRATTTKPAQRREHSLAIAFAIAVATSALIYLVLTWR